jgi:hypothetical protein
VGELHGEERLAVVRLPGLVDGRDGRMAETGEGLHLTLEQA